MGWKQHHKGGKTILHGKKKKHPSKGHAIGKFFGSLGKTLKSGISGGAKYGFKLADDLINAPVRIAQAGLQTFSNVAGSPTTFIGLGLAAALAYGLLSR